MVVLNIKTSGVIFGPTGPVGPTGAIGIGGVTGPPVTSIPTGFYPNTTNNVLPKIHISNNINMKWLKKAVYLSNIIFQLANAEYDETILYNDKGNDITYFCPSSNETIFNMESQYSKVCSIVYTILKTGNNISADNMKYLNTVYKQIKEQLDT